MKKIDVYINGEYVFTTTRFLRCKDVIAHLRALKHITIASIPTERHVIIHDYDRVTAHFVREHPAILASRKLIQRQLSNIAELPDYLRRKEEIQEKITKWEN